MKKLIFASISLSFCAATFAQTIPTLPKEWKGTSTTTSIGAHSSFNPNHPSNVGADKSAKGWNIYNNPSTLTITRQEGRHVEMVNKNSRGELVWVGTLSADGKQIAVAAKAAQMLFTVSKNTISGCGTVRGRDGTFDHWLNNYSAICFEFIAASK
jgi:hypothetical protein